MRIVPPFRLFVSGLIAALSCATALAAQSERRTLSGSSVSVFNLAGRMSVEAGSGPDVIVEVTRGGRDGAALRIESGELNGQNTLRVVYPDGDVIYPNSGNRWGRSEIQLNQNGTWGQRRNEGRRIRVSSRGSGNELWADVRILVPAGKSFEAHLGVGELTATSVRGTIRLESSSGLMTASGMRGSLVTDAGSGGIELRDIDVSKLVVDAGSGGVSLSDVVAASCAIDAGSGGVTAARTDCRLLQVDAGSGGIKMTSLTSMEIHVDAGSGGVQLALQNSPRSANIEAGSGGVTLELPASLSAELDIETGSGGIETDFPVRTNQLSRRRMRGTIGNGDGRIRIETGSGPVRLRRN